MHCRNRTHIHRIHRAHREPLWQHQVVGVDERDQVETGQRTEVGAAVSVTRGVGLRVVQGRMRSGCAERDRRAERLQHGHRERVEPALTGSATQLSMSGVVVRARSAATTRAHSSPSVSERATTTCAAASV